GSGRIARESCTMPCGRCSARRSRRAGLRFWAMWMAKGAAGGFSLVIECIDGRGGLARRAGRRSGGGGWGRGGRTFVRFARRGGERDPRALGRSDPYNNAASIRRSGSNEGAGVG